jgi:hypothetical protein
MGTGDLFGDFRERRIRRAGILESIFRHGDRVSTAMPFAHQPGARLQAETWVWSDSASVRNLFARVFSLRRVDLPSPPCWISWSR